MRKNSNQDSPDREDASEPEFIDDKSSGDEDDAKAMNSLVTRSSRPKRNAYADFVQELSDNDVVELDDDADFIETAEVDDNFSGKRRQISADGDSKKSNWPVCERCGMIKKTLSLLKARDRNEARVMFFKVRSAH